MERLTLLLLLLGCLAAVSGDEGDLEPDLESLGIGLNPQKPGDSGPGLNAEEINRQGIAAERGSSFGPPDGRVGIAGISPRPSSADEFLDGSQRAKQTIAEDIEADKKAKEEENDRTPHRRFGELCPVTHHTNKIFWVKELGGDWAALVHRENNPQLVHWATCQTRGCGHAVNGRCVQQFKYERVLVWKEDNDKWRHHFVWCKLPACCNCEKRLPFMSLPWGRGRPRGRGNGRARGSRDFRRS